MTILSVLLVITELLVKYFHSIFITYVIIYSPSFRAINSAKKKILREISVKVNEIQCSFVISEFHYTVFDILHDIFFCVPLKKESQVWTDMTVSKCWILGELSPYLTVMETF